MTLDELPTNPMQPYINHIRAMGVQGRLTVWCSATEKCGGRDYMHWTAFVGSEEMQFSSAPTFSDLVARIQDEYIGAKAFDAIALGM